MPLNAPIVLAHEQSFRIGDAEMLPPTREIRFAGKTCVVEPRVMQFLIALHRAGGAVVNKDDLLQACWNGRVVGDDAINRVVSRLRSVAEKEAGQQFRVETITKVGYRLVSVRVESVGDAEGNLPSKAEVASRRPTAFLQSPLAMTAAALIALALVASLWIWFRPAPAAHDMMVRLSGFRSLSADLPSTMRDSLNAEIVAAFNVDGVVGVSAAAIPISGTVPPYSLDGTIYRVGDLIRVISRLTNTRSGVVLWSDSVDYTADQASKIPHKVAADVVTVIRCGLSGAATHHKALPDAVLGNYMQYCQEYWAYGGTRTLRYAQLVVAEVPDFSWGWSAVGNGYMQAAAGEPDSQRAEALRAAGREAENKALALNPKNSEALGHKAHLIDQRDWAGQEALFKRAIAAKPLDCGCEHYGYGWMLRRVGRLGAATEQLRSATDMLALWPDSQLAMAGLLTATGRDEQARPYFDAAVSLSKDPATDKWIAVNEGTETRDYRAAIAALSSPQLQIPVESRVAFLAGYEALELSDSLAQRKAVDALLALPRDQQGSTAASLLATLGANRDALNVARAKPWLFWRRSMRGVLDEPDFPAVAEQLGLMAYWRTSRTKPDVCLAMDSPEFCRMI